MAPERIGGSRPPSPPPLSPGLPAPADDGAAARLRGRLVPPLRFASTVGHEVNLGEAATGGLVLYVFPRIGRPDVPSPPGWDETPGARGCTQQTCAFRDAHEDLVRLGYRVIGLSAQPLDEQRYAAELWELPFSLVADPGRKLGRALSLPEFGAAGATLYRRVTLIARAGRIVKVFYPVFPPDENAAEVVAWLRSEARA